MSSFHERFLARDKYGRKVSYTSKEAVKFCAQGAMYRAYNGAYDYDGFMQALHCLFQSNDNNSISGFNDLGETTKEGVIKLYDRAIALAEEGSLIPPP